ncbi:MAG: formimidoylglutamase [Thermonemataceae bacterium]
MYRPPEKKLWKGKLHKSQDPAEARWHQKVRFANLAERKLARPQDSHTSFALIGFRSDEGVRRYQGQVGATEGPTAIRKVLAEYPYHLAKEQILLDAGDVFCLGKFLEYAQTDLGDNIAYLLDRDYCAIALGGGRELAYGAYQGIHRHRRKLEQELGIISFSTHLGLQHYEEVGNANTSFLQIAHTCEKHNLPFHYLPIGVQMQSNTAKAFQTAQHYKVNPILAKKLHFHTVDFLEEKIEYFITGKEAIYLSVSLDVFSFAFAPGVGMVNGAGVTPDIVLHLIGKIARSGKVVCFDVSSLNPKADKAGLTAQLAASLVFQFIEQASSTSS